jgi:LysR family transcriptional regulator, glycine cleavage system transcriptional activator
MVFQGVLNVLIPHDLAALRRLKLRLASAGLLARRPRLNITTSAISHQLRRLEESLGTRLLEGSTGAGGIRATINLHGSRMMLITLQSRGP